jgi:hypothetical protein
MAPPLREELLRNCRGSDQMPLTSKDFHVTNANPQDLAALDHALTYINQSPTGSDLMQSLANGGTTINIVHDAKGAYDIRSDQINWDPAAGGQLCSPWARRSFRR